MGRRPARRPARRRAPLLAVAEQPRLLLAGSSAWGFVVPVWAVLEQLHSARGFADWTLVHRDTAGLERTCGRWWTELGGRAEVTTDPAAAAAGADACLALVYQRDPAATAVMYAALDQGLPVLLHYEGGWPFRPGTVLDTDTTSATPFPTRQPRHRWARPQGRRAA